MSLFEIGIGVHWCVCTYLYMYEPNIWVWEKHDHSTIWLNSIKLLVKFNHHFALLKFIMLKVSDSPHFPHFSHNEQMIFLSHFYHYSVGEVDSRLEYVVHFVKSFHSRNLSVGNWPGEWEKHVVKQLHLASYTAVGYVMCSLNEEIISSFAMLLLYLTHP